MREVIVSIVISAPREDIFDFVSDLSLRPSYSDHYLNEYRLARANPVGLGAAARFMSRRRRSRASGARSRSPRPTGRAASSRRAGSAGGAARGWSPSTTSSRGRGHDAVELTTYSEPTTLIDNFKQRRRPPLDAAPDQEGARAAAPDLRGAGGGAHARDVAGYDADKAPRFGAHVPPARSAPRPSR